MSLARRRGHCIPLWTVFPPLQVVLSSACFVANLSRYPSHYLPGHPHLREGSLADYLFGRGSPSTWCAGRTAVHATSSATPPFRAQRGMTLPRCSYFCGAVCRLVFPCYKLARPAGFEHKPPAKHRRRNPKVVGSKPTFAISVRPWDACAFQCVAQARARTVTFGRSI